MIIVVIAREATAIPAPSGKYSESFPENIRLLKETAKMISVKPIKTPVVRFGSSRWYWNSVLSSSWNVLNFLFTETQPGFDSQ